MNEAMLREVAALCEVAEARFPEDLRVREERLSTRMWQMEIVLERLRRGAGREEAELRAGVAAWRRDVERLFHEYLRRRNAKKSFLLTPRSYALEFTYLKVMAMFDGVAPDWRRMLDICETAIRRQPATNFYTSAAMCIRNLKGPLAAARYLEGCKKAAIMRDDPWTDWCLAKNYHMAGKWAAALRYYRRFLRAPHSEERRRVVQEAMRRCRERKV